MDIKDPVKTFSEVRGIQATKLANLLDYYDTDKLAAPH